MCFYVLQQSLTNLNLILKLPCPEIIWYFVHGFSKPPILQIQTHSGALFKALEAAAAAAAGAAGDDDDDG